MSAPDGRAITAEAIAATHGAILPYIRRTPVVRLDAPGPGGEVAVTLKLELLQHAGSFKARGAFANLLGRPVPAAGVFAASGGNHGAAVAYAAQRLGTPATIFVPRIASPAKIDRIRRYGARLEIVGASYSEALAASLLWEHAGDAMAIHAFDQAETVLGQGTLARELEEQAPDVDTILVPVGGGGLIAGIAAWYRGRVKVIGVEPEAAPTLTHALAAGQPVDAPAGGVAADSLAPRRVGALNFAICTEYTEGTVLVGEDAIRGAQQVLWDLARVAAEPGGAAAFAAVHSGAYRPQAGERVAAIVTGGNTSQPL